MTRIYTATDSLRGRNRPELLVKGRSGFGYPPIESESMTGPDLVQENLLFENSSSSGLRTRFCNQGRLSRCVYCRCSLQTFLCSAKPVSRLTIIVSSQFTISPDENCCSSITL